MTILPKIGIAGFGMEGRAVYEYFKDAAEVHIFDEASINEKGLKASLHSGLVIPADIPVVYKSPGIPTRKLSVTDGTRISTFMDEVLAHVAPRAIAVTGTKGKSTVASLIHHVLRSAGRDVVLFGNIGIADAQTLQNDDGKREYVIELSSYQCEHLLRSPHIAVLTALYEEHLSHHGSMDAYRDAKLNIARFQTHDDVFVNATDYETHFNGQVVHPDFSQSFSTKLLGAHNQRNCAIAFSVLSRVGIPEEAIRTHIASFEPLPYRLELIGTYRDISFYDDSLATVPEATLASLEALPRVDTLILGGEDRGISFDAFAKELATTAITTFIVFPDTGPKMVGEVADRRIVPVTSMDEAVRAAYAHTPPGGTVLLSNASPSFNLFKDYKDKSAQFRQAVQTQA